MQRRQFVLATTSAAFAPLGHASDKYPNKIVRIIVPFAAGGNTDIVGRFYAQKLSETFGQQFIVENRTGSGIVVASDHVSKSPSDGYTLLIGTSAHAVAASLYPKLPFDVVRDFRAISMLAEVPMVLSVNPSVPAKDARELVALLRKNPDKYSFGSSGNGASLHTAVALLLYQERLSAIHVPYRGAGPALTDTIAGQVDFIIDPVSSSLPFIKAGRLRPLAVSTAKRTPLLPDIPTMKEQGFESYETSTWNNLMVSSKVPDDIVIALATAIDRINAAAETARVLGDSGLLVIRSGPEHATRYMAAESEKWAAVVKSGGIRID